MRVRYSSVLAFVGAIVATQAAVSAAPVGSAFTYQGMVEDVDGPITDTCDLEFSLWDAESGGLQVGGSVGMSTSVEDGLFTVTLDFGAGAMSGEARWLELAVCCPSSCTVETLDPRQELTPAPQAIRAMEGVGPPEAINVDASGNVGIGTTAPARTLHIQKGIGSIRVDGDGNSPGMLFVRTAPGDFDTVWKSFGIGVKGNAPGSGELVISDKGTAVSGAGQRRLTIDTDGNVGIGTETPTELLTVAGNVQVDGSIKIVDGTQGTGKVLTSDASGGASWQAPGAPTISGSVYRWTVFSTYSQSSGWMGQDNPALFGGVAPSDWGDQFGVASQLSSDKNILRTLFTRRAYAGDNAMVYSNEWYSYSSTNSKHVAALFRIRNTTGGDIVWTVTAHHTACYNNFREKASIALNGVSIWNSGLADLGGGDAPIVHNLPIPANRTSTAIFISASSSATTTRTCFLAFSNDSLALPAGLEYVDDLDTASGGWDQ